MDQKTIDSARILTARIRQIVALQTSGDLMKITLAIHALEDQGITLHDIILVAEELLDVAVQNETPSPG